MVYLAKLIYIGLYSDSVWFMVKNPPWKSCPEVRWSSWRAAIGVGRSEMAHGAWMEQPAVAAYFDGFHWLTETIPWSLVKCLFGNFAGDSCSFSDKDMMIPDWFVFDWWLAFFSSVIVPWQAGTCILLLFLVYDCRLKTERPFHWIPNESLPWFFYVLFGVCYRIYIDNYQAVKPGLSLQLAYYSIPWINCLFPDLDLGTDYVIIHN